MRCLDLKIGVIFGQWCKDFQLLSPAKFELHHSTFLLRQHEEAKSSLGSLSLASKPLLHSALISCGDTPHHPNICRVGHAIFLQTRIHHATVGWNPRGVKTGCTPRLLKSMALVINAHHPANRNFALQDHRAIVPGLAKISWQVDTRTQHPIRWWSKTMQFDQGCSNGRSSVIHSKSTTSKIWQRMCDLIKRMKTTQRTASLCKMLTTGCLAHLPNVIVAASLGKVRDVILAEPTMVFRAESATRVHNILATVCLAHSPNVIVAASLGKVRDIILAEPTMVFRAESAARVHNILATVCLAHSPNVIVAASLGKVRDIILAEPTMVFRAESAARVHNILATVCLAHSPNVIVAASLGKVRDIILAEPTMVFRAESAARVHNILATVCLAHSPNVIVAASLGKVRDIILAEPTMVFRAESAARVHNILATVCLAHSPNVIVAASLGKVRDIILAEPTMVFRAESAARVHNILATVCLAHSPNVIVAASLGKVRDIILAEPTMVFRAESAARVHNILATVCLAHSPNVIVAASLGKVKDIILAEPTMLFLNHHFHELAFSHSYVFKGCGFVQIQKTTAERCMSMHNGCNWLTTPKRAKEAVKAKMYSMSLVLSV